MTTPEMEYYREQNAGIVTAFLKEKGDDTMVGYLTQLNDGCKEIETYYAEYDYDEKTPANGFRSFVKAVDKCFEKLAFLTMQENNKKTRKLMKEYEVVVSTLTKSLELARLLRSKGSNADCTEITATDIDVLVTGFKIEEADVRPFYSHVGSFWLRESFLSDYKLNKKMLAILSQESLSKKIRILSSKSYERKAATWNAINMTAKSLKGIANMQQFPLNLLLKLAKDPPGVKIRNVILDTNNDWVIEVLDSAAHAKIRQNPLAENERTTGRSVSCILIQPLNPKVPDNHNNSLIFHSHGGAFITGNPKFYANLLSGWANELGVSIICPDYAKAPEKPYPAGLQDLLDVYMLLTSGSDKVKDILGFQPENIILTGDSSGGNFSPALTIALNEVRKLGGQVTMPKGLSLQFPCSTPGPIAFPSGILMSFDTSLPPSICALALSTYAPMESPPEHGWQKTEAAADVLKQLSSRVKDPLYNILAYDGFDDLKDIPLRVMVCEFDPILDQGIAMAKKWKGDVKLQIARDLPHGFIISRNRAPIEEDVKEMLSGMSELLSPGAISDKLV